MRVLIIAVSLLGIGLVRPVDGRAEAGRAPATPPEPSAAVRSDGRGVAKKPSRSQEKELDVDRVVPRRTLKRQRQDVPRVRMPPPVFGRRRSSKPPRVPKGMDACESPAVFDAELPQRVGEAVRYLVDVDGLSIGSVDFKIEKRGTYEGAHVTEYRSLFRLDSLVAAFVSVRGRAASLVADGAFWPRLAMNDYVLAERHYEERVTYSAAGRRLTSERKKNDEGKTQTRIFTHPVLDFISGFYLTRSLPADFDGCLLLYGNQRAYTVWLHSQGEQMIETPVGLRPADRYEVVYGSEKSKKPYEGRLWLGRGSLKIPLRAEVVGKRRLRARIHLYESGGATESR